MYRKRDSTAFIYSTEAAITDADNEQLYVADLENSQIYTLNGVGLVIWELLNSPMTGESIISEMSHIYGVEREIIADSIFAFLNSLSNQGLIEKIAPTDIHNDI